MLMVFFMYLENVLVRHKGETSNHFEAEEVLSTMSEWGAILNNLEQKQPSMNPPVF